MNEKPTTDRDNPEKASEDDLLPEYDLDYRQAKPNHFAARLKQNTVVLDDDVAHVFKTSEAVNRVLRALIQSLPTIETQH